MNKAEFIKVLAEKTNHLGNVLTVIHDIKIPLNNGSGPAVSSYRVGIRTCSDYSPFGVESNGIR